MLTAVLPPAPPKDTSKDSRVVPENLKVDSPVSVSLYVASESQFTLRANSIPNYILLNQHLTQTHPVKKHPTLKLSTKSSVSQDSLVAENCVLGERAAVRKSVLGANDKIGARTTVRGSVIMENVEIGDNSKVEDCVICKGAKVGGKVSLNKCFVGSGFVVVAGTELRGQNLVELDEFEDRVDEDVEDKEIDY